MSTQRAAQLVEAGMWLQMSGDVDGARRLFEQALKLDPANARAKELLGAGAGRKKQQEGLPLVEANWAQALAPARPAAPAPFNNPMPPPPLPPPVRPVRAAVAEAEPDGFDWTDELSGLPNPSSAFEVTEIPFREAQAESWDAIEDETTEDASDLRELPEVFDFVDPLDVPVRVPEPEPAGLIPAVRPVQFAPNATSAWDSQSNPGLQVNGMKPGVGDAMDLVAPAGNSVNPSEADAVREEVKTLLDGARDLLELDDHSGAMDLIQKAQQLAPNDPQVAAMLERSETTLQSMFESKLGLMTARPRVQIKEDEIIWLNLDHRAGFVLAQIDGTVSFEDLFEVCGMSRLDTARILAQLVEEGVISA